MRNFFVLPALALVVACADTNPVQPVAELNQLNPLNAPNAAVKTPVSFSMAVSEFGEIFMKDLGRSGRGMIRDFHLTFDVTGDLVGTAQMILNANWDADMWLWTGEEGRGTAWGVLTIDNNGEIWEGNLTGEFVLPAGSETGNGQLLSKINLHGPNGQKLKAVCDETSPDSEVVACTGEILSPWD
ncbi:MAG: hypothetical protein ACWGSD_08355 [Thermodesulfobacteriota bacterium]